MAAFTTTISTGPWLDASEYGGIVLGLFALPSWTAEKRTREIGIRKVMGADPLRITILVTRDFLVLVLIGAVAAMPLAWFDSLR